MANTVLAKKIYKLQNGIVRELNDAHIFLAQIEPLLEGTKAQYAKSTSKKDRRYGVPSVKKGKVARRTDKELKAIYDHFIAIGLFEAFLVNVIARFEGFLADVLTEFFSHYPFRLTESYQSIPSCGKIEVKTFLDASDKAALLKKIISDHIENVFRQRPSLYIAYTAHLIDAKADPSFQDYFELTAARDLIVHNSRTVNQLYLAKAGSKARARLGELVPIDSEYYGECIATMKRVSGVMKSAVEKKYGAINKSS